MPTYILPLLAVTLVAICLAAALIVRLRRRGESTTHLLMLAGGTIAISTLLGAIRCDDSSAACSAIELIARYVVTPVLIVSFVWLLHRRRF